MSEDATLDAFDSADATENDEDGASAPRPGVDPAVSTYAWSPAGDECAACGKSVEARWRADGQRGGDLVCADCKEW